MARSFNGSSDVIDCGGAGPGGALDLANDSPFALMCWVLFNDYLGSNYTFLGKGYDPAANSTAYYLATDALPRMAISSYKGSVGSITGLTPAYSVPVSTWAWVYGDYDGTNWREFVNGSLVASGAGVVSGVGPLRNLAKFCIGAADVGSGSFQNYSPIHAADCALFSGPLDSTDITNGAAGRRANTLTHSGQTLLGYWPLIGTSPELDYSGHGNNGTLVNSPLFVADPPGLDPWTGGRIPQRTTTGFGV